MVYGRDFRDGRFTRHHNLLATQGKPSITGPINKGKGKGNTAGKGHGKGNGAGGGGIQLVGYQSYTWGSSAQAFNLNSLTGGEASPTTIKAGDVIVCCFGWSYSGTYEDAQLMTTNPGFYPLRYSGDIPGGGSYSLLNYQMIMPVLVDGAVSGEFAGTSSGDTCVAHFFVLRGIHPAYINLASSSTLNPASITPSAYPAIVLNSVAGSSATALRTFTGFGDLTDTVQAGSSSTRSVVLGAGLKRGIASGSYDGTAFTASGSLDRDCTAGAAFRGSDGTSAAAAKVPWLIVGGASGGSAPLRYGYAELSPNGTPTTSTTQLQGANSIAFSGSNSLRIDGGSNNIHPACVMRDFDWTMESMVRFNSTTGDQALIRNADKEGQIMFSLVRLAGKLEFYPSYNGTAFGTPIGATWTPSTGTNYHIRVACDYPTLRIFVGTEGGTSTLLASGTLTGAIFQGTGATFIGRTQGGAAGFNGNMGEIRFIREALNTTDSSFTAPSTPWDRY